MMSEHTPGPCLFIADGDPCRIEASGVSDTIDAPVYSTIAVFYATEQHDADGRLWTCQGDAQANARLFWAAPGLYRELHNLLMSLACMGALDHPELRTDVAAARAAIARATGTTPDEGER